MPHDASYVDLPLRKVEHEVVLAPEIEGVSDGEQAAEETQVQDAELDFLSKLSLLAQENPRLLAPLLLQARPDELPHALPELRGKSLEAHPRAVHVRLDLRAVNHPRTNRERRLPNRELESEERVRFEKAGDFQERSRRAHVRDAHVAPVLSESFDASAQRQPRGPTRRFHMNSHSNTGAGAGPAAC